MTAEQLIPTSPPTTVVVVVDGRWSGALAYALERALEQPSLIRMVCAPEDARSVANVPIPIEVSEPGLSRTLDDVRRPIDSIVAEGCPSRSDATPAWLASLRDQCDCLLVEVTSEGRLVRVSGPPGRAWGARRPAGPAPAPSRTLAGTHAHS